MKENLIYGSIGIVGLGKMGINIGLNLHNRGYRIIGFDNNETVNSSAELQLGKPQISKSLEELVTKISSERCIVWVMVPHGGPTESTIKELSKLLKKGDIVIDGSNSYYEDSIKLYGLLKPKGISYIDAGCSGGPEGARNGMSIMVGGDEEAFNFAEKLFKDLSKDGTQYGYFGASGSGHFAKMVHNAVEYAMMQAIGEGFSLLKKQGADPNALAEIARVWSKGAVVSGHLMELTEKAFRHHGTLSDIKPYVEDTGEAKWAILTAVSKDVPMPVIEASLNARFSSRGEDDFSHSLLSALRNEFGGHAVRRAEKI
jgi:6-phosphogluconate dehydrogenase